ncbi:MULTISPECIES: hypothetical protein [Methylobacterium]|uniref:hypothetical protein n=1 Tax=Methylobacterium TaxID=407 RepID=UPI0011C97A1E|nr:MULTISPECIES: hypothetical protein [Methylobacterium]TXN20032.1 hypothetical protein FV217_19375 [Methylobacterium sp. WL9]
MGQNFLARSGAWAAPTIDAAPSDRTSPETPRAPQGNRLNILLTVVAIISLIGGLVASFVIQSDIRVEIVATCWIGGFLLMGIAHILMRLQRIERLLTGRPAEDPEGAD